MKKSLIALIVGLAMLVPSAAFASSSSCKAYAGKTCPPTSNTTTTTSPAPTSSTTAAGVPTVSPATTTATATATPGTLPFTGLDLVALLGGATVLLGAGLLVRHLSREHQN